MKYLLKSEKALLKQIASFYGCRVKFVKGSGGAFLGEHIEVGDSGEFAYTVSAFCHELGHFQNWKTNKYPAYHNQDRDSKMSLRRFARYALDAELYTDRVGEELCKFWFPRIKYRRGYKDSQFWLGFCYGYYLTDFIS